MADEWPDEAAVQLSITTELRPEDALRYLEEGWSEAQIRSAYDEARRRGCALC